jgi:hypothetical protein
MSRYLIPLGSLALLLLVVACLVHVAASASCPARNNPRAFVHENASDIPAGNYKDSCKGCRLRGKGKVLYCSHCHDGVQFKETRIKIAACRGIPIDNQYGKLVCANNFDPEANPHKHRGKPPGSINEADHVRQEGEVDAFHKQSVEPDEPVAVVIDRQQEAVLQHNAIELVI